MTEHKTLLEAFLAVQAEAPAIQKSKINPAFKSKYVSLDTLMETVMPILNAHGLIWVTLPCRDEGEPALNYRLVHVTTGEAVQGTMPLMLAKTDPQGQGSAITYSRRYSLMAVLGLVADEDDDGNSASKRQAAPARATNGHVTREDLEAITAAAKGLKTSQIRLALGAIGIDAPEPFDVRALQQVPKTKAAELAKALAGMERVG